MNEKTQAFVVQFLVDHRCFLACVHVMCYNIDIYGNLTNRVIDGKEEVLHEEKATGQTSDEAADNG